MYGARLFCFCLHCIWIWPFSAEVQHDHSADKEHWDLFASVLVYLPEAEVKILKMECECGHLASAALGEKDALLNGMEDSEQKRHKKLVSMVAAVNRYLSFCEKLDGAGHFDRTVATFRQLRGVLSPEDAEIQSAIAGAIDLHTRTLRDSKVELENLLAPANNWKAALLLDASLEDTMAAAETTLMTVKGKKLSNAITVAQKAWERAIFGPLLFLTIPVEPVDSTQLFHCCRFHWLHCTLAALAICHAVWQ